MAKSTTKRRARKAGRRPPEGFPLWKHPSGRWCKKVRGRAHYFGRIDADPDGEKALEEWLRVKDDLLAGRTPRPKGDGLTVADLCNRFLTNRHTKMEAGELSASSFADYYATCDGIVKAFGRTRLVSDLDATDFERFRASLSKGWSPVTLSNEIQRIRVVFRYAVENQLVPGPIRYGAEFKKPSKRMLRLERAKNGPRMFEAADLRTILNEAAMPLNAMILLAINCGYGASDIANLPIKAIDFKTGWVSFPRPKTGIPRRCKLWSETLAAVKAAPQHRSAPKQKEHEGLLFITKYGGKWAQARVGDPDPKTGKRKIWTDDPVGKEFTKLIKALGLHRRGLGFYAIRHTFETIGGDSRDQVAVDAVMGHVRDDMASLYRERIDDARLVAVTDHVRTWLFGTEKAQ